MESARVDTNSVEKTLELPSPPERVWRALTDPAELGSWFPDRVDGLGEGDGGWMHWEAYGRFAIRVVESEAPRRLVWRWAREADTPLEDGPTTTVEWTLEETEAGGTRLHLRESGFADRAARDENDAGWDHELGELREYLAT